MKMQDKDPGLTILSWVLLLLIACWGGLVRYLMDIRRSKTAWSWFNLIAQLVVSGFAGLMGGLMGIEAGMSIYKMFVAAGVCGSMGSIAVTYFWERYLGVKNANQQ